MIHLRARTVRRYGGGHVRSVTSAIIRDPSVMAERLTVPARRERSKNKSDAQKQLIMAALIEQPDGVALADLATLLGLGESRTYMLIDELRCEGLADRLGKLWIAQV